MLRRLRAFDVSIGSGGIPRGLDLCRLLGRSGVSGAVMAAIFDVLILGEWWDDGGATGDLANAIENDCRTSVVELDCSMNFDGGAGQAANVADIFQSGREDWEDHDREGAGHLIFAEVEEVNSFRSRSYLEDSSRHTSGFANLLCRIANWDAIGGGEKAWGQQHYQDPQPEGDRDYTRSSPPASILRFSRRKVWGGNKIIPRVVPEWT